jgi:spermidine/putrescine transport system ATP-binding protein
MGLPPIHNLARRCGDFVAVDAGEFFTLLGPSCCGKTTLLRTIAGFDRPDACAVVLDGLDLTDMPPER